ncbi:MAG: permease [Pseudomonadota bacterium]|uniref:Permease n=1 Tax=Qipengyuania flava TaxID=192812 RepID=A0A3T1CJK8_9SPHN|nr:permease [Qipengyuania flava]KZX55414.1 permease [Erythrobacter sp. HI00D59]KZX88344.1 permease [Erythrobacter sp. HI0020]KZY20378.1 permease [Erythrobacter sp. HI0038]KZY23620.1 permease [Erythrobacter sp. HI0037]MAH15594.1 permease [Sphingomonadaceae bacterium]MEC7162614.1 permease [Pseudomonadota bacterium]OAN81833.1 permease [Erythrobacter sp. EhN03]HCS17925.1 permease [Erythrobacter sp.]
MNGLDWASYVGFCGTACIIAAYAYLTFRDEPNPFILHGTNLMGAALLTVSLVFHTNWPSLVLEGFWASIAIYGIVKALRSGRTTREREA